MSRLDNSRLVRSPRGPVLSAKSWLTEAPMQTVRAEVASVTMPIESVLSLKEGDLLRLNAPAAAGITLYADKVPVHTGRPGRSGSRRAVQVTGRLGGGS